MFTDQQLTMLNTNPDPSHLSKRPDGMTYLTQHYVFSRANEVFGLDGWAYEAVDMTILPNGVVTAKVRVSVPASGKPPVTDVGTGVANPERTQSYETAIKDAVTDGVKRSLRTFGLTFGLNLYDKDSELHSQANTLPNPNKRSNMGNNSTTHSGGGGGSSQPNAARWPADVPEDAIPENPVCVYSGEPFEGFTSSTGKLYTPRVEAAWAYKEYGATVKKRHARAWLEERA